MLKINNRYEKYHASFGGEEEARKANYTDMVRDAVTTWFYFTFFKAVNTPFKFKPALSITASGDFF